MLYGYKLSLNESIKIKKYKKSKNFNHKLVSIENTKLQIFEILVDIFYKQTIPLNLFEKYSLRLIKKAKDIYACMDIKKIANLFHLDEKLIRENLNNLAQIGMINGFESDDISINYDDDAEYLQHENKFEKEKTQKKFFLKKEDFDKLDTIVKDDFKKNIQKPDKKYLSHKLAKENKKIKEVKLLKYSDDKFLIFSDLGVNHKNDLIFINHDIFSDTSDIVTSKNFYCHEEEFLPIMRDKIALDKNNSLVIIFSKEIEKDNLDMFKIMKSKNNLYIFTNSKKHKDERIFFENTYLDDIFIIGKEYFAREDNFIHEIKNKDKQNEIKTQIENYFIGKIKQIEPNYDKEKLRKLDAKIDSIVQSISNLSYQSKKNFDDKIKKLNEDKNKLYGLEDKKANQKSQIRKQIDKFEEQNNNEELKKYPKYLQNKAQIQELKNKVYQLQQEKEKLTKFEKNMNTLNQEKSNLISEENKDKVYNIEKELKNIKRLYHE